MEQGYESRPRPAERPGEVVNQDNQGTGQQGNMERSPSTDPEERRLREEEENLEEWQTNPYTYSVKATLMTQTKEQGSRIKWTNPIRQDDWLKDNFNTDFLRLELDITRDSVHAVGDYISITAKIWIFFSHNRTVSGWQ